ncbi:MAG: gliding motility-associated C-terminal domain-containing protein [Chitinophaga sp.]|uniref:gliding motility-associated C-terminal domain-containing protein n=1 Tax=Chitinophaga sp. TaxID=1869181 RepID=UPI0025BB1C21|nr:gliding motility-associated C-terminal domain-containing protein [Chitinophaga sp.]MBV8252387.1 gliding motility-associated C-terminal domain-containing protein [Chitinophaga sp.]
MKPSLFQGLCLLLLLLLLLFPVFNCYSQDRLYVVDDFELGYVDISNDTYTKMVSLPYNFEDLAITPAGNFYGIYSGAIFQINPVTGVCTFIPLTNTVGFSGGNSLVSDRYGNLFVADGTSLYKVDMTAGVIYLLGTMQYPSGGDLCFSDGKLYVATTNNLLLEVTLDAARTKIVAQRNAGRMAVRGNIFGIGCNQYGICYIISTLGELALVDLLDATTYIIANPVKGPIGQVNGIAMMAEGANDKDVEICNNGIDDDGNGLIDSTDMACSLRRGACTTDSRILSHEDFGTGTGFGAPLPGLSSNAYKYANAAPQQNGYYSVINNPQLAKGDNTWKSMPDHSGQPNGRMLVIGGSIVPGEFYRKTFSNICGGQQYALSFSACSVISPTMFCGANTVPIPSRVRLQIADANGKILGEITERYIPVDPNPSGTWKNYGFLFTIPPNITTIQVILLDDAPGGCGNDLAVDDIIFSTCKPIVPILVNNTPTNNYTGCVGSSIVLAPDLRGLTFTKPVYEWQKFDKTTNTWKDIPGATGATYTLASAQFTDAGQYQVLINDNTTGPCVGGAISETVTLTLKTAPVLTVKDAITVCAGSKLQLQASTTDVPTSAIWKGPDGSNYNGLNVVVTNTAALKNTGDYTLTYTSSGGCTINAKTTVTVRDTAVIDFSMSDTLLCTDRVLSLRATGVPADDAYTWSADGNSTFSGQQTLTPQLTWNTPGVYAIKLTVVDLCIVNGQITHSIPVKAASDPGSIHYSPAVCVEDTMSIVVTNYGVASFQWRIDGNPNITGTGDHLIVKWNQPGTYAIAYTITGSCNPSTVEVPGPVAVHPLPTVMLGHDTVICNDAQLFLQPTVSADVEGFSWQDGPFSAKGQFLATAPTTVKLKVRNQWGCTSTAAINLSAMHCGCDIYVPTAFTPNGDGRNDLFRPVVYCATSKYFFQVFNRWGQLIFGSHNPGEGWNGMVNGRKADIGSYVWILEYENIDHPGIIRKSGTVTLVL